MQKFVFQMTEVLKLRHSLKGKNLLPVAVKAKAAGGTTPTEFARLKRDHPLERYTLDELVDEFERLTGEDVGDIFMMAGFDATVDNMRLVMHFAIIQANLVGAPKGKALVVTSVGPIGGPSTSQSERSIPQPGGVLPQPVATPGMF